MKEKCYKLNGALKIFNVLFKYVAEESEQNKSVKLDAEYMLEAKHFFNNIPRDGYTKKKVSDFISKQSACLGSFAMEHSDFPLILGIILALHTERDFQKNIESIVEDRLYEPLTRRDFEQSFDNFIVGAAWEDNYAEYLKIFLSYIPVLEIIYKVGNRKSLFLIDQIYEELVKANFDKTYKIDRSYFSRDSNFFVEDLLFENEEAEGDRLPRIKGRDISIAEVNLAFFYRCFPEVMTINKLYNDIEKSRQVKVTDMKQEINGLMQKEKEIVKYDKLPDRFFTGYLSLFRLCLSFINNNINKYPKNITQSLPYDIKKHLKVSLFSRQENNEIEFERGLAIQKGIGPESKYN